MALIRQIAFYSPIPGSGSTLVSKAYADYIAMNYSDSVSLVSCDFRYSVFDDRSETLLLSEGPVNVLLPHIRLNKCNLCKACAKTCVFGAIKIESAISHISLKVERCRACGACLNTCRYNAIGERERLIGRWRKYSLQRQVTYYEGLLLAEDFFAIQFLQQLITLPSEHDIAIIDANSGFNYPAMESLHGSDVVVMVIDPSTFTVKYYQHILKTLLKYHHNIIAFINYQGSEFREGMEFLRKNNIPVVNGFPDLGLIKPGVSLFTDVKDLQACSATLQELYSVILYTENIIASL